MNEKAEFCEDWFALTLLAQEQRTHLDLAANIGLNLVEKNTQLEQRVVCLEVQLEASKETIKQIRHQLALKDDLLQIFNSEFGDHDDQRTPQTEQTESGFSLDKINVSELETRLVLLEDENIRLRDQPHNTPLPDNSETVLANDCIDHILESTKTIDRLSAELRHKTDDYLSQHEEIGRLLASKLDLENKTQHLVTQNDHLITLLRDYQTKEFTLTKRIAEMRDRYDECINLLNEKKGEIRRLKKEAERESIRQSQYYECSSPEPDLAPSLAMELGESYRREGEEVDHSRTLRIMDQARLVNTAWLDGDDTTSSGFTEDLHSSSLNVDHEPTTLDQLSGNFLLRRSIQNDCERRRLLTQPGHCSKRGPALPQGPGRFSEALSHQHSLNSSFLSRSDSPTFPHNDRCHGKLQLLKPIQGSQTLRAWQTLAIPSFSRSLFEDQPPGVCFRGQQFLPNSPECSPNSNTGHCRSVSSDFEDLDYEEPKVKVRSREQQEEEAKTWTNLKPVRPGSAHLQCEDAPTLSSNSPSVTKERVSPHHLAYTHTDATYKPPPGATHHQKSWLDRLLAGSIMTSFLGYPRPASVVPLTSVANSESSSCLEPINPLTEKGLISRLLNVPALARTRSPQGGLNLLTSLAPSHPLSSAIYCSGKPNVHDPEVQID